MLKFIKQSGKKTLAAMTLVTVGVFVVIGFAGAVVYKFNESDPLRTDIGTPSCTAGNNQSATDIAMDDNRIRTMVWEDDSCDGLGNGTGIFHQRYDVLTGPAPASGGPTRVNTALGGDQKNPSIAMDHEGNYVVVWHGNGPGDTAGIFVRAFNRSGTAIMSDSIVNTTTTGVQDSPKVAMDFDTNVSLLETGEFVVVWHGEGTGDTEGIYMQRYSVDFSSGITPIGANILVNTYTTGSQVDPDVAMNNFREALVTWSGPGTGFPSTSEIWMQGYDSGNTAWGGSATNARVNSTSPATKPAIASDKSTEPASNTVAGGKSVIVYEAGADVNGKLVSRCGAGGCPLGTVELNINSSGDLPDVAMDYLGNFTVTWEQDDTPEGQYINIHGINYDYLGRRIDSQFRINDNIYSDGAQNQTDSAVAKDKDGEYFVSWTTPSTALDLDARYKGYGTDIFKRGNETLAHTGTAGFSENSVSTAIAPNGYHAVAFLGQDTVSLQTRVYYSLYNDDGNVVVENQVADTVDNSSVSSPSISFFKDTVGSGVGRFVIAWTGTVPATTDQAVLYREFDITGTPATPAELEASNNEFYPIYVNVTAGYYNNSSSTVIDRFAFIYQFTDLSDPAGRGNTSAYHTAGGFTYNIVEPASLQCQSTCGLINVDTYADINGSDRIVYVWEAFDGDNGGIFAQEANGSALGATLSGSAFVTNNTTTRRQFSPDVAFVSPTQYVVNWNDCPNVDCTDISVYASRYTGNFAGGAPTVTDDDFVVYPGGGFDIATNTGTKIAGDPTSGSFLVIWNKIYDDVGYREVYGKYFETTAGLANFGIGFVINATKNASPFSPGVDMNSNGRAIVGWEGAYTPSGISIDSYGAVFQLLNNPTFVETIPELPTAAQLSIVQGGKTLTIPSVIQFPSVTASTSMAIDVEREIDQNPAVGQPLFFQLEDLGGNSTGCVPGPCYSVTISSTAFTYTDPATAEIYTIPASNIFIKNYDGNHPGVVNTGTCGTPEAELSFEALYGIATDFELDASTCDYVSLDTNRTLMNKISNGSDTAKILWYPKGKITIPALTPPGTYTGTITITSA